MVREGQSGPSSYRAGVTIRKKRRCVHQLRRAVSLAETGVNPVQSGERALQSLVAGETTCHAVGCAQLPGKSLLLPGNRNRSVEGLDRKVEAAEFVACERDLAGHAVQFGHAPTFSGAAANAPGLFDRVLRFRRLFKQKQ